MRFFLLFCAMSMTSKVALAEGDASLPQLDISTFPTQIFWLAVFFALLYVILSVLSLPRISRVLESRQEKIDRDLEDAKELRDEAIKVQDAYEASLAKSHEQVHEIMSKAQEDVSKESMESHRELSQKLSAQVEKTEKSIADAKTKALAGIQETSTIVAIELANKLSSIVVNDNDAASAVKKQVKER